MNKYIFHNKIQLGVLLLFKLLSVAMSIYFSIIIRDFVNLAVEKASPREVILYGIFAIVYLIMWMATYALGQFIANRYTNKSSMYLKNDYFASLINGKYENIACNDTGYYISALTNDVNLLSNGYVGGILGIFDSSIAIIGAFVTVMLMNWKIGLMMLSFSILLGVFPIIFKNPLAIANMKISDSLQKYVSALKNNLKGFEIIKSFNAEENFCKINNNVTKEVYKNQIKSSDLNVCAGLLSLLIINLLKISILILAVYYAIKDKIDIGTITALFSLASTFYSPIMSLGGQIVGILGLWKVRKKVFEILSIKDINESYKEDIDFNESNNVLSIRELSYSYPKSQPIINNVCLNIEIGKKYLLIGSSGSGKTTLLKILAKLFNEYEGRIGIGENDFKDVSTKALSKGISFAQQEAYIFDMSIKNNIDITNDGDSERLNRAIELSQLQQYIKRLPNGIETIVNEDVSRMSEGEKQRINLARTLYKNSKILLLDEITASLDLINTNKIEKIISSLNNTTVIYSCHKYSEELMRNFDFILLMRDGKIIKIGDLKNIDFKSLEKLLKEGEINNEVG